MARINVDLDKLKVYLYEEFDMNFSREWDFLPDNVKEEWTQAANEVAEDLITKEIVTITD
jgi:hypothetical protein